jgi:hypothetical protein
MNRFWLLALAGGLWMCAASLPAADEAKKGDAKPAVDTPLKGTLRSSSLTQAPIAQFSTKICS